MNKSFKTEGIVIRKFSLNEADQILTVLTRDHGKISCVAKGSRRITSRFCGRVELLYRVTLSAWRGSSLDHLQEIEMEDAHAIFDMTLDQHRVLFALAEITNKLVQDEQQIDGLYDLLMDALTHLKDAGEAEVVLHAYLTKLLTLLGFMAPWNHCARTGRRLNAQEPLFFCAAEGCVVSSGFAKGNDLKLATPLVKWVNFMQSYPLTDVLRVRTTKNERAAVWQMLLAILQNVMNSPLKSEAFLMGV